jgi:hypothetical protein
MKLTLGEAEECSEGACPFWETGIGVVEAGCGLERLPVDLSRPDLAAYLLGLRAALESARETSERDEGRRALGGLAPPELSGR